MKYLMDTQILLWAFQAEQGTMTRKANAILREPESELFVSIASLWEITIKISKGKLNVPGGTVGGVIRFVEQGGTRILEVLPMHLIALESLPHLHGDPFDRLIVAQARAEKMRLVSVDRLIHQYEPTAIR
jgi:PIN domain nuclease of toxin-antitoxin system